MVCTLDIYSCKRVNTLVLANFFDEALGFQRNDPGIRLVANELVILENVDILLCVLEVEKVFRAFVQSFILNTHFKKYTCCNSMRRHIPGDWALVLLCSVPPSCVGL